MAKKRYRQPELVEYGSIDRLTLGSGGTQPDFQIDGDGTLKLINIDCFASPPATACLLPPT